MAVANGQAGIVEVLLRDDVARGPDRCGLRLGGRLSCSGSSGAGRELVHFSGEYESINQVCYSLKVGPGWV